MRASVVGLGRVGYEFGLDPNRPQPASHFHCYQHLRKTGVSDVAVVDISNDKLEKAARESTSTESVHLYHNTTDMLKIFEPDVVSICSPTNTHKAIVLATVDYPSVKTIFLEKPIAQSLKEADIIIGACKKAGVNLAVNYSRRWSTIYRKLIPLWQEPLNYLHGIHPGPLMRTGTHMIDLFNMLNPFITSLDQWEAIEVQAFGNHHLAKYMADTEDFNVNGYIYYPYGRAVLMGNLNVPENNVLFELDVFRGNERHAVTGNGTQYKQYVCQPSMAYSGLTEYMLKGKGVIEQENLLLNAIQQVVRTAGNVGEWIAPCTGMDARNTLYVALALHYSASHGNRVVKLRDLPYDYTVRSY